MENLNSINLEEMDFVDMELEEIPGEVIKSDVPGFFHVEYELKEEPLFIHFLSLLKFLLRFLPTAAGGLVLRQALLFRTQ